MVARLVVLLALVSFAPTVDAEEPEDQIRLEPASQVIGRGATVSVHLILNSVVATSGTQASVTFDSSQLRAISVRFGEAFTDSPLHLPTDLAAALRSANASGSLTGIAAADIPPRSVPAGDNELAIVEFRAIGCGTAQLKLPVGPIDASLLDGRAGSYGLERVVATTGGAIAIDCSVADSLFANIQGADGGPPWVMLGIVGALFGLLALILISSRRRRGSAELAQSALNAIPAVAVASRRRRPTGTPTAATPGRGVSDM